MTHLAKINGTSEFAKVRSIEEYWGVLKQRVFQSYLQAKNICQIEAQFKLLYQKTWTKVLYRAHPT